MIVDCAVYENGARAKESLDLDHALDAARARGGFVWIGLHEPTADEFATVAEAFDLHPLAVEDAIHAHQRPKLERYGDSLFMVFKPSRYVDAEEVVEVGQIMVFLGPEFVVTVRHGPSALTDVRRVLEEDPDRLQWGPASVLYAIADKVVDDYAAVMVGLDNDIDQIEQSVFAGPKPTHAERIFKLKREVLDFRRAVDPLEPPLAELAGGIKPVDERSADYFRDVHDHVTRVSEHLAGLDALLDSALNANVAQVGMRQNEDMRKITAWVAIIATPTMIAGIYGMNFEHMPELEWTFGYPLTLSLMVIVCIALYRNFKRRDWL
ncbi:MAG TPA: magnesium/cobalt transporter CorA [Acidimicrobiales bacterium]|nr:magnesium/cobalt transporter CorA [Acidimicrobiales bacterium]